jgi:hypothetical protein
MKREVYREYDITSHGPAITRFDHLIPLELDGSNSDKNLWPESHRTSPWNAQVKLEAFLSFLTQVLLALLNSDQVWVNTRSGKLLEARVALLWQNQTGEYMPKEEAVQEGYRPANGELTRNLARTSSPVIPGMRMSITTSRTG